MAACDAGSPSVGALGSRIDTVQTVLIVDIPGESPTSEVQLKYPVAGSRLSDGTLVIADGSALLRCGRAPEAFGRRSALSNTDALEVGVDVSAARLPRHGRETPRLPGELFVAQRQGR